MRTSLVVISSLLAGASLAQPHRHNHHLYKRAVVNTVVEEVVVVEYVTEIVNPANGQTVVYTDSVRSTSPPQVITTIAAEPAQFFEGESSTAAAVPSSVASVEEDPTTTAAYRPPKQSAVETEAPPPPPQYTEPASSGSGGSSSSGQQFTGDMTYFAVGVGSCGHDSSGQDRSAHVVAIAGSVMQSKFAGNPNNNPLCGQSITISANGKTTTATIWDTCPECLASSIDVSEAVFLEIFGDLGVGRSTVSWHFNS